MDSCDLSIFGNGFPGMDLGVSDTLASTLLLLLSGTADSFITNISMIPTTKFWYFKMTPFEAMFMGFVVVQITILHWLQILPMNINQFVNGMASGRKKRHIQFPSSTSLSDTRRSLAKKILQTMRHLDNEECFQRALCEIQHTSVNDHYALPRETQLTLTALKRSSDRRRRRRSVIFNDLTKLIGKRDEDDEEDYLTWLEDAVDLGSQPRNDVNGTICSMKYDTCTASTSDIISYYDLIQSHYFK